METFILCSIIVFCVAVIIWDHRQQAKHTRDDKTPVTKYENPIMDKHAPKRETSSKRHTSSARRRSADRRQDNDDAVLPTAVTLGMMDNCESGSFSSSSSSSGFSSSSSSSFDSGSSFGGGDF